MRIVGIVASPRKGGNTEILVGEALASAKEMGADVELLTITGKNLAPCDGCEACRKTGRCIVNDDMQEIHSKLLTTDGVVFGTPVYFWGVTAQAKAIIDRTYALLGSKRLRNKVAGAIVVARRAGGSKAFSMLHDFFNMHRMILAGAALGYTEEEKISRTERGGGVIACASEKGDVRQDTWGMAEAKMLGRAMVKTLQAVSKAKAATSPQ